MRMVAGDARFGLVLLAYRVRRDFGIVEYYGRKQRNHGRGIFGIP